MMTTTMKNILEAPVSLKHKVDGKLVPYETNVVDSEFKACPSASKLSDPKAKKAMNALETAYQMMSEWAVITSPLAAVSKAQKAKSRLRVFLAAVLEKDDSDPVVDMCIDHLWANIALKRQKRTVKYKDGTVRYVEVKEALPGKATVLKQWLFAVYYYQTTGQWVKLNTTQKKAQPQPEHISGYSYAEICAEGNRIAAEYKKKHEEEAEKLALLEKILAQNPDLAALAS